MHAHPPAYEGPAGRQGACSGACHACALAVPEVATAICGARMVGAALLVFVLPLVASALGARLGGPEGAGQIGGALIGLLAGAFAARWLVARSRALRESAP